MSGRAPASSRWVPLAVFALVLAVRAAALVSLDRDVLSRWPEWTESDEHGTLEWSARLAAGNWLDSPPYRHYARWQRPFGTEAEWNSWYPRNAFYQGALYPYLVALVRVAAGDPVRPVRLLQALLAAGAAAALAAAARGGVRQAGGGVGASALAGLVAGLGAGLYAPAVFHDLFVQRDGPLLSISVLLLALPFLRFPRTPAGSLATGLLAGGAILLKQTVAPLALASLWAVLGPDAPGEPAGGRRRRAVLGLAGLALPIALLVGRNLAAGASPLAYDTRQVVGFAGYVSKGADATVVPSPLTGRILAEAKGSTLRAAVLAIRTHSDRPAGLLLLTGKKVATFFHGFEVPDNGNFYLFRKRLPALRPLPVYACLLGPGLVGLALAVRRKALTTRAAVVVGMALLVPFVSSVLPSITSRYRLGVAAPLALGSGFLAAHLASSASRREKAAALAAALVVSSVTLLPPVIPASKDRATDEQVLAWLQASPPPLR